MKKFSLIILIVISAVISTNAYAADKAAGKTKAVVCAACHGPNGHAVNPLWPNLAGQNEAYLAKQIIAFRDGTRKDPSMSPMVAGLTDEDAANIAAYFSSLK
jgi:cytochrome c553